MPDISTPHISKDWREDYIIAMRTQDASGEQIGDALATVDAHCAESGESAEEAFGDPTTYATTLVPEPAAGPTPTITLSPFSDTAGASANDDSDDEG